MNSHVNMQVSNVFMPPELRDDVVLNKSWGFFMVSGKISFPLGTNIIDFRQQFNNVISLTKKSLNKLADFDSFFEQISRPCFEDTMMRFHICEQIIARKHHMQLVNGK